MLEARLIRGGTFEHIVALMDNQTKKGGGPWYRVPTGLVIWAFSLKTEQKLDDLDKLYVAVSVDGDIPKKDGDEAMAHLNPNKNANFSGVGYNYVQIVREKEGPPVTVIARFSANGFV